MPDVVVTVPKSFGWSRWILEGDAAGDRPTGQLWDFSVSSQPNIDPGERVYVVHNGVLRGYAPLVSVACEHETRYHLVRGADAVAMTIARYIPGFRGFRYRDWDLNDQLPYPEWKHYEPPYWLETLIEGETPRQRELAMPEERSTHR